MSHNVEQMAFVGKVPWWGIGVDQASLEAGHVVNAFDSDGVTGIGIYLGAEGCAITGEELRTAAGMDFTLQKQRLVDVLKDGMRTGSDLFVNVRRQPGHHMDGFVLGAVRSKFTNIQNVDLFTGMDDLVARGLCTYETAGVLGNGERVWALARIQPFEVALGGGRKDTVEQFLLWTAAHDGQASAIGGLVSVRTVCQNTLDAGLAGIKDRVYVRHTASAADRMRDAHQVFIQVVEASAGFQKVAQQMADTRMNVSEFHGFAGTWLDETRGSIALEEAAETEAAARVQREFEVRTERREAVVAELAGLFTEGTGNTGESRWDAYNAVTEYLDHKRKSYQDSKAAQERHFKSTLLGDRYKQKGKALALLTR